MKISKTIRVLLFISLISTLTNDIIAQSQESEYAVVFATGRSLSSKHKVQVDLGDTPEQIEKGEEFAEAINKKKSFTAILNYMFENDYELFETVNINGSSYQGSSSGTAGVMFIFRKRK